MRPLERSKMPQHRTKQAPLKVDTAKPLKPTEADHSAAGTGSAPKPGDAAFGIRVDGKASSVGLESLHEAELVAIGEVEQGRHVEIFDMATKKTLKRL